MKLWREVPEIHFIKVVKWWSWWSLMKFSWSYKKFQIPDILAIRASVGAGVRGSDRKKSKDGGLKKKIPIFDGMPASLSPFVSVSCLASNWSCLTYTSVSNPVKFGCWSCFGWIADSWSTWGKLTQTHPCRNSGPLISSHPWTRCSRGRWGRGKRWGGLKTS